MFSAEHATAVREAHRVWSSDEDLYTSWYARPRPGVHASTQASGCPPLAGRLRVASSGSWATERRVVAVGIADTVVVAGADGRSRAVSRGDYWLPDRPGRPARVGDRAITVGRSGGYETDGWWRCWGGGWDAATARPDVTRIYFAVDPSRVVRLAGNLSAALAASGLGWMLKVAAEPAALVRPDAAVLYVIDADAERGFAVATEAAAGLVVAGKPVAFARPLVPGVSWSEDPGGGSSFGERMCGLLAEAFATGAEPVAAAADAFSAAGIDPSRPHLRGERR